MNEVTGVDVTPGYVGALAAEYLDEAAGGGMKLLTDVANWADAATAPRGTMVTHPESDVNQATTVSGGGAGTYPVSGDNRPGDLPMAGATIDDFFRVARILSSQDVSHIGGPGSPHEILTSTFASLGRNLVDHAEQRDLHADNPANATDGTIDGFTGALRSLFTVWDGDAKMACLQYCDQLKAFMEHEMQVLATLLDCLAAYGGALTGARFRHRSLMQAFVNAMHGKQQTDAAQEEAFENGMLATIFSAVASFGFSFVGALVKTGATPASAADEVMSGLAPYYNMATTIGSDAIKGGKGAVAGPTYAQIAQTYLDQSNAIVDDLRKATADLRKRIQDVYDNFVKPPDPPLRKTADHNQRNIAPPS